MFGKLWLWSIFMLCVLPFHNSKECSSHPSLLRSRPISASPRGSRHPRSSSWEVQFVWHFLCWPDANISGFFCLYSLGLSLTLNIQWRLPLHFCPVWPKQEIQNVNSPKYAGVFFLQLSSQLFILWAGHVFLHTNIYWLFRRLEVRKEMARPPAAAGCHGQEIPEER